jgi:hypothetical protein
MCNCFSCPLSRQPGPSRLARVVRRLLLLFVTAVFTAVVTAVITVGVQIGACVSVGGDVAVCAGATPHRGSNLIIQAPA